MNLVFRNALVVLLASATLLGGLFNPPYVEPAEAIAVPSIEKLGTGGTTQQIEPQRAETIAYSTDGDTIERDGKTYVALRGYVENLGGRLTYNRETSSIDITVGVVSYSLLLAEGTIMTNGYELEGDYFVENGTAFIHIETAFALQNHQLPRSQA
ncbi:hypothetical protein RB620_09850 [Paenibacillus sp. LHD-117]|uniref:hypothetical protein n=1 Tax=Paenibacillus sp. LHD-117 TaxID=3071412 RepID=UPI0027E2013B|nr:hypothetical protein [Paenibacillus sp. LHD-117]MDQ6419732.1 hypothetical protein [Paenibacillus sp. LHD-117]